MGNTCFMSAILQCFTHTVQMFLGLRYCTHASSCKDLYFLFSVEFLGILDQCFTHTVQMILQYFSLILKINDYQDFDVWKWLNLIFR